MCKARTLAHGKEGYIIKCKECKRIQLAFGTAVFIIDQQQLERISDHIFYEMQHRNISLTRPEIKQLSIEINEQGMLCLSINEVLALQELIDQANAVEEAYRIISKPMEWEN